MLALAKKVFLLFLFFLIIFLCTVYSISYAAWEQVNEGGFGDTNNEIAGVMSLFDGSLYVGTGSTLVLSAISGIWRSPDGTTWEPVNTNGFGDTNNTACDSMVVYGDYLYGGTSNESGCELWRSSDGTVWDRVNAHGFGDTNNDYFPSMIVYDDLLYAGTGNVSTGCELWRSPDGTAWDQVNADGFGDSNNTVCYAMIVYDDLLYVGTGNVSTGFQVWRSSDGTTWDQVNTDGFGDRNNTVCTAMIVYGGYLYVGTRNKVTGCELWRSPDGTTWDQVNTDGFGDGRNEYSLSMIVYDYLLYAGTANSLTGCQIWCSSNGTTWEQSNADGLGDSNNKDCPSMIIYGDYLYAGTSNRSTGCQIWRYSEFLTFTISGSVTGAVSSFVPVHLTGTDSQIVKTDASGNYHFTGLASGAYVITPELEGYKFEPPNHKIKSLAGDLSDRDFVSRRAHPCAAETIYGENAKEVELLRNVRDTVLSQTPEGKEIVRLYYQWSPAIAEAMKKNDEFKKEVKEMLDGFLSTIEEGG